MECPSCGAAVRDPEALYCGRCAAPLPRAGEGSTAPPTTEHRVAPQTTEGYDPGPAPQQQQPQQPPPQQQPTPHTTPQPQPGQQPPHMTPEQQPPHMTPEQQPQAQQQPPPDTTQQPPPQQPPQRAGAVPVHDFAVALQRSFVSGGWGQAAGAAAIGFLTLVGLGALIVAAIAIGTADSGGFGSGIGVLGVLSLVVLFGLSVMGVGLEIGVDGSLGGEASLSMVWLGAILVFGYVLTWATARAVAPRGPHSTRMQMFEGAKVAVPFAFYSLLAALLFKLSQDGIELGAGGVQAFVYGLLWAALFGAIGGLKAGGSVTTVWGRVLESIKAKRRSLYEGMAAGGIMLGTTAMASAAAFLIMIIVALARGDSLEGLTVGGVVAALIILVLLLPNVLSLIAAVALGAPLGTGFGVVGNEDVSIIGLGGRSAGALALLLLLIPLLACLLGGFSAYRHSIDRSKMLEVLGAAALTYALTLAALSLLNNITLDSGFTVIDDASNVSTNFFAVLLLGLLWAAALGFAGWRLADMQGPARPPQQESPQQPHTFPPH